MTGHGPAHAVHREAARTRLRPAARAPASTLESTCSSELGRVIRETGTWDVGWDVLGSRAWVTCAAARHGDGIVRSGRCLCGRTEAHVQAHGARNDESLRHKRHAPPTGKIEKTHSTGAKMAFACFVCNYRNATCQPRPRGRLIAFLDAVL